MGLIDLFLANQNRVLLRVYKGRTIKKVMGGGGGGLVREKKIEQGKMAAKTKFVHRETLRKIKVHA